MLVTVEACLSGAGSDDPDGTISSYEWGFGEESEPGFGLSPGRASCVRRFAASSSEARGNVE